MAGKQVASDFEKMIHEARDRKKNEALAARIFGKDRRSSAPHQKPKPALGGSLASRVGVKKRVASTAGHRNPIPTGPRPKQQAQHQQHTPNINGEWTHDLHEQPSSFPRRQQQQQQPAAAKTAAGGKGSLASRISNPNAPAGPASRVAARSNGNGNGNPRRAAQVARALISSEFAPAHQPRGGPATVRQPQNNGVHNNGAVPNNSNGTSAWNNRGITIRGLAGPFVVMAQNFAPGTTAADIESAVTPVGGIVQSCRLLKTEPIVIAEIVFESKEGADNVIATFNNQTADGRLIHVYYKVGGASTFTPTPSVSAAVAPAQAPREPRAIRETVVDGSMGFDDPMEESMYYEDVGGRSGGGNPDTRTRNGNGGLYSDSLVPPQQQQQSSGGYQQQQQRRGGGGGGGYGRQGGGGRGGGGRERWA